MKITGSLVAGLGLAVCLRPALAALEPTLVYETLQFESADTFFTGIHANIITANSVIPGTTYTGGLLYDMSTGTWSAFPEATANGANYPGAIISSPYGPSFGSQYGVLRAVGSYQTTASSPYDLGYLYDAAAAPGQQLTTLQYPSSDGATTLFTIAHSTFGNQVVGNYDTRPATGNAFIYDIKTGTYTTNNKPGAVSTTAYGIWGDKIAGGYFEAAVGGGVGPERGYIYDKTTGTFTEYNHPGAVGTHFEGIVGAGRADEYNVVANWFSSDGEAHPAVMHVAADGTVTWYEITIPGDTVSSNSAYGDKVVGIIQDGGTISAYIATIPGIYNPIRNTGTLTSGADNAAALSGRKGDDIVNSGTVSVTGVAGVGMRGETYGVLTNTGTVTATGLVGAAVELHGLYGTLLNSGTLQAPAEADALRTGPDSYGTVIVNTGVIDGRIAATAGPDKRFENSGWIGVTGTGISITHMLSGTYVQTQAGTLSLRVLETSTDFFGLTGVARLAGTLEVPFLTSTLANSYTLMAMTEGMTGTFDALETPGLPSFVSAQIAYSDTTVALNLTSQIARQGGLSPNQAAVGAGVDRAFNSGASATVSDAASGLLTALYGLSAAQLPQALSALSGEAYASQQTVLIGDGAYSRTAVLDRLRQGAYGGSAGPLAALAYGGPALAYLGPQTPAAGSAAQALAYATKAPEAPSAIPAGTAAWVQGFGGWTSYDGSGGAFAMDSTIGGIMAGADIQAGAWRIGAAMGYSQSGASVADLNASSTVNSMLLALYGGTMLGPVNVRLGATYAFNQIDASRAVAFPGFLETATAQYDGGTAQIFGEVGYGFAIQALALEPFAGLAFVHLSTDGFTETGASASGISAGSSTANVGYGTLGIRAATSFALSGGMVLAPHASAAWQYAFGDTTPSAQLSLTAVPGTVFSVSGVPVAQNAALVEGGVDLILTPEARIGASYVGQFGDGVTVNAFSASLSWRF